MNECQHSLEILEILPQANSGVSRVLGIAEAMITGE
jgi:hypothetical protein